MRLWQLLLPVRYNTFRKTLYLEARRGYGDTTARSIPDANAIDLGSGKTATSVSTGSDSMGSAFSCAVLNDGSVKCFGANSNGQLGTGSYMPPPGNLPATVDLGTGRTATSICSGQYHSCAALDGGTMKCWGQNNAGQVGNGLPSSYGVATPTEVAFSSSSGGSSSGGSSSGGSSSGGSGASGPPGPPGPPGSSSPSTPSSGNVTSSSSSGNVTYIYVAGPPGPGGPPGSGYLNPNANVTADTDTGAMTHANTLVIFAFSTLVSLLM